MGVNQLNLDGERIGGFGRDTISLQNALLEERDAQPFLPRFV